MGKDLFVLANFEHFDCARGKDLRATSATGHNFVRSAPAPSVWQPKKACAVVSGCFVCFSLCDSV